MAQTIPLSDDARSTFRIILGGQEIRIRAWWQPLDENWYLSMLWLDGRPIILGVRIDEAARPLDGRNLDFQGALLVDGIGDVGRNAWTTTHRLIYLTAEEAAAHLAKRKAAAVTNVGYPDKPAAFAITQGDAQAALSFSAGSPGISALVGWQYRFKTIGAYGDWVDIPGGAAVTNYTVPNLMNDVPHVFQVRALNATGWSQPSVPISVTPTAAPAAPASFVTIPGDTTIKLTGTVAVGTHDILRWEYKQATSQAGLAMAAWNAIPNSATALIDYDIVGLANGTPLYFQARIVNRTGNGAVSAVVSATPMAP